MKKNRSEFSISNPNSCLALMIFTVAMFLGSQVFAGQLSLGVKLDTWTTNFVSPVNGTEFFVPFALNFNLNPDINVYGETEFGVGSYTPSIDGSETTNLSALSDSLVGTEMRFKFFSLPALLNIGINIPSGDPTWESKQITANIPSEFVDTRYTGRGLGISALYGLSFPAGSSEFGMSLGYSYAGTYNPGSLPGLPSGDLKLGDSMFISVNHVTSFSGNQSQIIRLSAFNYLTTQVNKVDSYKQGPNFNASYSWNNPKALSFELGIQYFAAGQRPSPSDPTVLVTEANQYWAPRFYLNPTYALGDLTVSGLLKYVLPNGYTTGDAFYDGGGWLAGLEPNYKFNLDGASDIKLKASYQFIIHHNAGQDINLNYVDADYNLFTFGAYYEVRL